LDKNSNTSLNIPLLILDKNSNTSLNIPLLILDKNSNTSLNIPLLGGVRGGFLPLYEINEGRRRRPECVNRH